MVFSFLKSEKQDKALTLLIDIGSASVGAALAHIGGNKPPHILATVREDIPFQESLSSARFLTAMNRALERALKNIQTKNKGRGAPAHIFCTLSSPWFMIKSRSVDIARAEPFEVTEKTLDAFLNEDIERLKTELVETLPADDIEIIEKKIIHMRLNGYEIKNPYGQKTNQMSMVATVTLSSKRVIESVRRRVGRVFHAPMIHFGAFPVAAFSTVRDLFPEGRDFLFLDITGEATDVSLVRDDVLLGTISFSRGKNFFVRELSVAQKTPHQEAASLLTMFFADALDGGKRERVARVVAQAKEEWVTRFSKTLATLAGGEMLPSRIFFTADTDVAGFFTGLINTKAAGSPQGGAFEVSYIGEPLMTKFTTFESEVLRDPFLSVEALFAAKILEMGIIKK